MLGCTFLSMILLVAFNIICLKKFGLLSCYSAYGAKWGDWEKEHHFTNGLNIWSVITFLTAALLIPPMLTTSAGNPLQFLCFFAPVYLFLVAFTPYYTESKVDNLIHQIGSWTCVVFILFWLIFVVHKWFVLLPVTILTLVVGLGTNTFKESVIYYLEVIMYITTYIVMITMFI